MAFTRIALGWALVALLLLGWDAVAQRVVPPSSIAPVSAPARLTPPVVEALLLTLFAGLWFGSLGSGGAVLLFLLVGSLMEIPSRLRSRVGGGLPWRAIGLGVARIVVAGELLSLVLS
jgi:hypothetical protein